MEDLYGTAQSNVQSKAVMNMFVCAPRQLLQSYDQNQNLASTSEGYFSVEILERHPFTTQTFIPLGLSSKSDTRYLVIVAPSLPPSSADESLPVPVQASSNSDTLPGRGFPDLRRLQAFIADGSQAVTYGAGTWHAPMIVVGAKAIDFVVVQFANGVGIEDCQEVLLEGSKGGGIMVVVPRASLQQRNGPSKL
jgi:ureidoglycolate lyase